MSRRKRIHGHRRVVRSCPLHAVSSSPLKSKWLDRLQVGLSFAGTVIPVADAINATISGGRAIHAKRKGDDEAAKKYRNAALINTAAIMPGVGEAIKGGKGLKAAIKPTKWYKQGKDVYEAGKNVYQLVKTGKGAVPAAVGVTQTIANAGYWTGTGQDIKKEFKQ